MTCTTWRLQPLPETLLPQLLPPAPVPVPVAMAAGKLGPGPALHKRLAAAALAMPSPPASMPVAAGTGAMPVAVAAMAWGAACVALARIALPPLAKIDSGCNSRPSSRAAPPTTQGLWHGVCCPRLQGAGPGPDMGTRSPGARGQGGRNGRCWLEA